MRPDIHVEIDAAGKMQSTTVAIETLQVSGVVTTHVNLSTWGLGI